MRLYTGPLLALLGLTLLTAAPATAQDKTSAVPDKTEKTESVGKVEFELTKAEVLAVESDYARLSSRTSEFDVSELSAETQAVVQAGIEALGVSSAGPSELTCGLYWPPGAYCCEDLACCTIDVNNGAMCYVATSND